MIDSSASSEEKKARVHEGLSEYEEMRGGMLRTVLKWALWVVLGLVGLLLVYASLARLLGLP